MDGSKIKADGSKIQINSLAVSTIYPERQPTPLALSPFARPLEGRRILSITTSDFRKEIVVEN
ncbi:MAG: hypothetical protein WBA40_18425 [Roseiarcus sp.]